MKLKTIGMQILISAVVCSLFWLYQRHEQKKTAVVDAVRLFNEFNMKKEMEAEAGKGLSYYEHQLDSVTMLLQAAKNEQKDNSELVKAYQEIRAAIDNEYTRSNQIINESVWKRLNPMVDEYGKKHGLHLVIGANGMGTVLFNDNYYDHTQELIKYVNRQYEAGK